MISIVTGLGSYFAEMAMVEQKITQITIQGHIGFTDISFLHKIFTHAGQQSLGDVTNRIPKGLMLQHGRGQMKERPIVAKLFA